MERPQENWLGHVEDCAKTCGKSLVESWQASIQMFQSTDGLDYTCSCKRVCDRAQFVMPLVVAEEGGPYQFAAGPSPAASPFSPRRPDAQQISNASSSSQPFPVGFKGTRYSEFLDDEGHDESSAPGRSAATIAESRDRPGHLPLPAAGYEISHYAEYEPVLRPPSSVGTSSFVHSSSVRPPPWAKYDNAHSRAGVSAISGGAFSERGESPAREALLKLKGTANQEAAAAPGSVSQAAAVANTPVIESSGEIYGRVMPSATWNGMAPAANLDEIAGRPCADEASNNRAWEASPSRGSSEDQHRPAGMRALHAVPPIALKPVVEAAALANAPSGNLSARHEQQSAVAPAWATAWMADNLRAAASWLSPPVEDPPAHPGSPTQEAPAPKAPETQQWPWPPSTPTQSEPAQKATPTPTTPKPFQADDDVQQEVMPVKKSAPNPRANATKSVLSQATGLKSSSAMALAGLGQLNASRRGKAPETGDLSSVPEGPATLAPTNTPEPELEDPAEEAAPSREVAAKEAAARSGRRQPGQSKSVLSQSMNMQSSSAMALGSLVNKGAARRGRNADSGDLSSVVEGSTGSARTAEHDDPELHSPKPAHALADPAPFLKPTAREASPDPGRRKPGQTKSVLSQSLGMQSASAMALGALASKGPTRRVQNAESGGDLQSVVVGDSAGSSATRAQREPESDKEVSALPPSGPATSGAAASSATGYRPKPRPKAKGIDAGSVISGLNSSSAASTLLGPMLQGQAKKKNRQGSADSASVLG